MDIIEKAIIIASQAHEGQFRKSTDIPYITHPYIVGMLLLRGGYREEVVAAGILHDTLEDTRLTYENIESMFGEQVAQMVEACSEPDKILPWEERKKHTMETLKLAPIEVRAIVCADKIHNLKSIHQDYKIYGEKVWERFSRGKTKQEWYYRSVLDSLGSSSSFDLLEQLEDEINKLF